MSILLIGANGSMGRRYQAILRHLGQPFRGVDSETGVAAIRAMACMATGVILATPTPTHAHFCLRVIPEGVPLLCEKPVTRDLAQLDTILARPGPFTMMAQYAVLDDPGTEGETVYDFYQSGGDGLAWDCVTLLGLARGSVLLRDVSPIWTCQLNGKRLTLDAVGRAYVDFVVRWLEAPSSLEAPTGLDRAWVRGAHEMAARWTADGINARAVYRE